MKQITNILTQLVTDPGQSSDEHKQVLIRFCNVLTGQTVMSTKQHLQKLDRGMVDAEGNPIDTSQDNASDPQDNFGRDETVNHRMIAVICNGVRHALYGRLHSFADLRDCSDAEALLKAPKVVPLKQNYDQPYSAEEYIGFMSNQTIRATDVAKAMRRGHPEHLARAAFQAEADRNNAQWQGQKSSVLYEIGGYETTYSSMSDELDDITFDETDFVKLPLVTQLTLAERVSKKIDDRLQQLMPLEIRDIKEAVSETAMLKGLQTKLGDWRDEFSTMEYRNAA